MTINFLNLILGLIRVVLEQFTPNLVFSDNNEWFRPENFGMRAKFHCSKLPKINDNCPVTWFLATLCHSKYFYFLSLNWNDSISVSSEKESCILLGCWDENGSGLFTNRMHLFENFMLCVAVALQEKLVAFIYMLLAPHLRFCKTWSIVQICPILPNHWKFTAGGWTELWKNFSDKAIGKGTTVWKFHPCVTDIMPLLKNHK